MCGNTSRQSQDVTGRKSEEVHLQFRTSTYRIEKDNQVVKLNNIHPTKKKVQLGTTCFVFFQRIQSVFKMAMSPGLEGQIRTEGTRTGRAQKRMQRPTNLSHQRSNGFLDHKKMGRFVPISDDF